MLLLIGQVLNITTRRVEPASGSPFSVTVVHLLVNKSRVEYVDLSKEFGAAPEEGREVALRVSVQAYASKKEPGKAGWNYVAWEDYSTRISLASEKAA